MDIFGGLKYNFTFILTQYCRQENIIIKLGKKENAKLFRQHFFFFIFGAQTAFRG